MPVDIGYLRGHYAGLSDDALLEIDGGDLVEAARAIYAEELQRRNLSGDSALLAADTSSAELEFGDPDWMEDAAEVYSHYIRAGGVVSQEVENARSALEAAGIPCLMELCEEEEKVSAEPEPSKRWRLLVPGKLNQYATSVIERDIFNEDFENQWRSHLEMLSDEELRSMHPQTAFCGLFDRMERVTRAYKDELAERGLSPEAAPGNR